MSVPYQRKSGFDFFTPRFSIDLSLDDPLPGGLGKATHHDASARESRSASFDLDDPSQNDNTAYGSIHIPP